MYHGSDASMYVPLRLHTAHAIIIWKWKVSPADVSTSLFEAPCSADPIPRILDPFQRVTVQKRCHIM